MVKRVLFDKFHESDCAEELFNEMDYMELFCIGFLLSGRLQELSPIEYMNFQNEVRRLFNMYERITPGNGFSEEEAIYILNDIQSGRPGSATYFAKRITPHKYLTNAFLQLKPRLSNEHPSPNQKYR